MSRPAFADDVGVLSGLLDAGLSELAEGRDRRRGPLPRGGPGASDRLVAEAIGANLLPTQGVGAEQALTSLCRALSAGSADPTHPHSVAHLHCPPVAVAVAAETVVAALNQSLDSWDQAPAAMAVEQRLVGALTELVGYTPGQSAGVLTTGGTESNLMGLLLARDATGKPGLRVFCSELAHFSVARGASLLGLGADSVVGVGTDSRYRMDPVGLKSAMAALSDVDIPSVVVATAGTTEYGSIDPIPDIAAITSAHRAWLHVDAAYGGGALFSDRLAPLLDGIAEADSVALDFHKFGWQPIAAGAFLARRADAFAPLARTVGYLNSVDDESAGYPSLLGYSLRTTRRADAVKIVVTMQALGRAGLAALVDQCHDLACYAARRIAAHPQLTLLAEPELTTVVFSYRAKRTVNAELRRRLLEEGTATVGRVELDDGPWLKITLLNPRATNADIDSLLGAIVAAGAKEDT